MVNNNLGLYFGKIILELLTDILYFPLWWYGRGFLIVVKKVTNFWVQRQKGLALFVWIKNIFKPMYGQTDWQGIMVSIIIRVVQIIFRSIAMFFWLFLGLLAIIIWIALPVFVVFEIVFQLIPESYMQY